MKFNKGKIIFLFLVLSSCSWVGSFAQNNLDDLIKQIKMECDKINNSTKSLKVTEEDVNNLTSEGGILKKFIDGQTLQKAELTLFGETGQSVTQYYFLNGELIFISDKVEKYKAPIYMGKVETDSIDKNEFYFKSQVLMRWFDNENKIVDQTQYLQKQIEILEDLKIIKHDK